MELLKRISWLVLVALCLDARAGSLKDYKNQKHRTVAPTPAGEPVAKSCEQAFLDSCGQSCGGAPSCLARCQREVGPYCEARARKASAANDKLLLEALLLLAGPLITLVDEPRKFAGDPEVRDFDFVWDEPSFNFDLGVGLLEGPAYSYSVSTAARLGYVGLGGNAAYLNQGGDYLGEFDVGPRFYLGSRHISAAIQPSLLGSMGNGVKPLYGFGVRTDTVFYLDRIYFVFSPMLGGINGQSFFTLRAGLGYRFTPLLALHLAYELRAITDLHSLDIASQTLMGGFVYFSFRLN